MSKTIQRQLIWLKILLLYVIGGAVYAGIELLWRGQTHWTMFVVGGLCFVLIGLINEFLPWDMACISQMLISALIITAVEYVSGLIVNVWLGWGVWDYSHMPYNLHGQICLLYSNLWFALSIVGIVLDDWLRYWLWREELPHYKIL